MYFYTVKVLRDEEQNITGYKVLARTNQPRHFRGLETRIALHADELDPDFIDVAEGEDGELVLTPATAAKEAEIEIALRMRRQDFGRRLIAMISIRNDLKGFTPEQVVAFATTYASVNSALLNGSIGTAKALIEAITPDGVITTAGDKTAMLDEIEANEAALGYA